MKSLLSLSRVSAMMSVGLISFASLALVGCNEETAAEKKQLAVQTIAAKVQTVELGTIPMIAVVPGAVVPDQKATISSRLMGFIKVLDLKEGQKVKRGELLFSIDSSDVKSGIIQAQSGYDQAKAGLMDAKLDYDRFEKLYQDASVSKQQFDKISLKYKVAQENLASAQSGLNQAKSQLKYANVRAPFDGVVVKKMASAGDLAAPGSPVVELENLKSLSVQTQVAEDLFAVLRPEDEVLVVVDGQKLPLVGTIYALVSAADPATRTHTVKLSLPAINNVNSGTFARVNFKRGDRQTLMIPKTAIVNRSGIEGVFVLEDGKAYFHMVRLGEELEDLVEVQAGLSLGDVVVVDNNISMLNGDLIDVIKD